MTRRHTASLFMLLVLLSGSPAQAADPNFVVGIVFSATATSQLGSSLGSRYTNIAQEVTRTFTASGMSRVPTVVQYPNSPPTFTLYGLGESTMTRSDLFDAVLANTNLRSWRSDADVDLIVLVVKNYSTDATTCGQSAAISTISPSASTLAGDRDFKFVSMVRILGANGLCNEKLSQVVVHEIGHLLFAEHEITNGQEVDGNGNVSLPSPINHAYYTADPSQRTVMFHSGSTMSAPVFSGDGNYFPVGSVPAYSANANVKQWFNTTTISHAAAYEPRSTQSVALLSCWWEYAGCAGNMEQALVSWQQASGPAITKIFAEISSNSGASWNPYYQSPSNGGSACTPVSATTARLVRIFGWSPQFGLTNYCHVYVPLSTCSGEERW